MAHQEGSVSSSALSSAFSTSFLHRDSDPDPVPGSPACPRLDLVLTPMFDGNNAAVSVMVEQKLSNVRYGPDDRVLSLPFSVSGVDVGYMATETPTVRDAQGLVSLSQHSESLGSLKSHVWKTGRATDGDLHIAYTALPRPVSSKTRCGPALDFRTDHGGLVGAGFGFLALPVLDCARKHAAARASLRWDLSGAPAGTSAAWSFGDGEDPVHLSGPHAFSRLQESFFALGPLRSLHPVVPVSVSAAESRPGFNMYWLNKPPFDPRPLGARLGALFARMSTFFRDAESGGGGGGTHYRVFLRHNPFPGSLTGTALQRSFLYGFDDSEAVFPPTARQREAVLAHEMVHNWVRLDEPDADADPDAHAGDNWFAEGMAEYYSLLLRYRFGLLGAREYLAGVNERLAAYYTNPLVGWPLAEVEKRTWEVSHAQRVPYQRGFTFGLVLNGRIREATGGRASLDDLVVASVGKRQAAAAAAAGGGRCGMADFFDMVAGLLGDREQAARLFADMRRGTMLVPAGPEGLEKTPFAVCLVARKMEGFELGFDETSLLEGAHVLTGLVPGSRADKAGLRNGDRLSMLFGHAYNRAKDVLSATLTVRVQREGGGDAFTVEYWPRSWEQGEGYQFEEVGGDV